MPDLDLRSGAKAVAGIFVGGKSTRMQGAPKGLLTTNDGQTLVARWWQLFETMGLEPVLVGAGDEYTRLAMARIGDAVSGVGPLGGVIAVLERAQGGTALTVACDMPYVSRDLVEKLLGDAPGARAVAPRRNGLWEPFLARYQGSEALTVARRRAADGAHGLQGLLDELRAECLVMNELEWEQLRDWDTPDDVQLGR